MKKFIFIIAVIVYSITSFAQTLQVDWGELYDIPKSNYNDRIVGYDKDGFYTLRSSGEYIISNSLWLDYYSSALKSKESSVQLLLPTVEGMMTNFYQIYYIGGKLVLITTVTDSKKKVKQAYVSQVTKEGTLANKPVLAAEIPMTSETDDFFVGLSPDKTRIYVTTLSTFEKYAGQNISVKVYDSNTKEVVNKNFQLPLTDRNFSVLQIIYGNSGNVYFGIKAEQVTKRKSATGPKYDYMVIAYNTMKKDFDTYNIVVEKYLPADMFFTLDNEEQVVVFGFTTPKSTPGYSGFYYQKINPKIAKIELTSTGVFSREMILEFADKRNGETPEQYYNFKPKNILFLENGSAVFLAEQYYMTTRTMIDPKTKAEEVIYYYNYNDIIAASANKAGAIEWTLRIPKNQKSLNDNAHFISFASVATRYGSKVKILYVDNPSNLSTNSAIEIKELKRPQKGIATILTIYNDGSIDKARMFEAQDLKFLISPSVFIETPGQFFIQGTDGKQYKMGSFFFD